MFFLMIIFLLHHKIEKKTLTIVWESMIIFKVYVAYALKGKQSS